MHYGGYLRPSELLNLRTFDCVFPEHRPHARRRGCYLLLGMRTHGTKVRREKVFARASALHLPRLRRLSSYVCFEALFAAGVRAASEGLVS